MIVQKAAAMFQSDGYAAVNIDAIFKEYNIDAQLILDLFENKAVMTLSIVAYIQDIFDKNILIYAYDKTTPSPERLVRLHQALEDYFAKNKGACLFINFGIEQMHRNSMFTGPIWHYFSSLKNAYSAILEDQYPFEEAQEIADIFVANLQGALIMARINGTIWSVQRLTKRFLQKLHANGTMTDSL